MAEKHALLVMDVQNGIVERYARSAALTSIQMALKAFRQMRWPVIFVRTAFRPGYPDISARNQSFSAIKERGRMEETSSNTQIWAGVGPRENELVVVKRRVSAFAGSGLELLLRSLDIEHLTLTGISTSGVVLSTLRQAADLDYRLLVLSDACVDDDPWVHRVLMEKVFPRQAEVMTVREWFAAMD